MDQPEPQRRQPQHGPRLCGDGDAGRNDLSEGRGTTRALELFGAPDLEPRRVIAEMERLAPEWLRGCKLRDVAFQPTFHKHAGELNHGVFIHAEGPFYDHLAFKPWRLQALAFKAIRQLYPGLRSVARFPVRI